jgi:branched-chain amino acid transport system permease protein
MDFALITLINALSYGLILFLVTSGLTLVYGLMGVMNFAHAGFYMLGAYLAYSVSQTLGFVTALLVVPLLVGALGWAFERFVLSAVTASGHKAEMLVTFGLSLVLVEVVQWVWGTGPVPYAIPPLLDATLFSFGVHPVGAYRVFSMAVALAVVVGMMWGLTRHSLGLRLKAAATNPEALAILGHDVERLFTWVFATGCALAGLAGVLMGNAFSTEPGMALHMGALGFAIVVMGGLGSLTGALVASLLVGLVQTVAASWSPTAPYAALVPYLMLLVAMIAKPQALQGMRDGAGGRP